MSEMTPEQLAQRVVRLILATKGRQDLTAARVVAQTGVQLDEDTSQGFSGSGSLVGGDRFTLDSITGAGGMPPERLDFTFSPALAPAPANCMQPVGVYHRALVDAGFIAQWIAPPRPGSPASWHFERDGVVVYAFVASDAAHDDLKACISVLQILVSA